jgi:hypothetical protein
VGRTIDSPELLQLAALEALHVASFGSWRHLGATLPVTVSKLLLPSSPLRQYMFGDYVFGT